MPGAGWIGLDPTSGLLAGEGHIPLACTAVPASAAPVTGWVMTRRARRACTSRWRSRACTRTRASPSRTATPTGGPSTRWASRSTPSCCAQDVRLTQGGEPTFVSIDDMDGEEWSFAALSPKKRELAGALTRRLMARFAPGALLHVGQGKWYPGEPLPRWALGVHWRADGIPDVARSGAARRRGRDRTALVGRRAAPSPPALARRLGLHPGCVIPAYEDVVGGGVRRRSSAAASTSIRSTANARRSGRAPAARAPARARRSASRPGYVLPIKPPLAAAARRRATDATARWRSSRWPLRREHLYLMPGDSPLGLAAAARDAALGAPRGAWSSSFRPTRSPSTRPLADPHADGAACRRRGAEPDARSRAARRGAHRAVRRGARRRAARLHAAARPRRATTWR